QGFIASEESGAIFDIDVRDDAEQVRADIERGDLTGALVIPRDLTEMIQAGQPVALKVLRDPGSSVSAGIWSDVVRAGAAHVSAQIITMRVLEQWYTDPGSRGRIRGGAPTQAVTPAVPASEGAPKVTLDTVTVMEIETRVEKQVSMISYYAAGMTGMFLLFGSMFGAFSFAKERREQTLARMLSTPASKVAVVGGKAAGVLVVGVGQFVILVGGTRVLFGVDWGRDFLGVAIVGLAETLAAAGLAMTLAAVAKSERAIGAIAPGVIMFLAATGGSMIPSGQLPSFLQPVQVISPVYWTVDGLLDLMRGASTTDVLPGVGAVLLIAVALFAFGTWRLKYE
ncbi:MAG: ABC transporter permease, partial [Coriobacteriales bacterium]